MGANIFHCGGPGTGETAKLANNLILGITMVATSEGMAIGEKLGICPKVLTDILSVSTGSNFVIQKYNPRPGVLPNVPASNNYDGGFGVALIKKDLGLALDAAEIVDAKSDMTEMAKKYYDSLDEEGYGKKDYSFVYQYIMKNYKI